MKNNGFIQVGDYVTVITSLYIEDYDYPSHHFKCKLDHNQIPENLSLVYIPVDIALFDYAKPPEIRYVLPHNFNMNPQTIINRGHYIFKPFPRLDFEKTGKIIYDCLEDASQTFECVEGVRETQNTNVLNLISNSIQPHRIQGKIDRIFRLKLGNRIPEETTLGDRLLYCNSIAEPHKYNSVHMIFQSFKAVILVENYEIYVPTFFIKKVSKKDEKNNSNIGSDNLY